MLDWAKWLDIVIDAMVKSCRSVPKWDSARRLAGFLLDKKWNRQPFHICGRKINIGDLRVSTHRAMAEELFLKPSAIVVAKNEDQGGLKL